MQKAKAEAEEAARGKSDHADESESNQDPKASQETQKDTPKPADTTTSSTRTKSSSSRSKHQKTKSEAAREATFASLQRALNAAVAARERYGSEEEEGHPGATSAEGSASPTAAFSVNSNQDVTHGDHQSGLGSALSEWDHTKDSSMSWTSSHSSQGALGYGSLNATPLTSAAESMTVPSLDGSQHQDASHDDVMQNIQFHPPEGEEWPGQMSTKSLSGYHSTSDAEAPYNTAQYHMQPELSLSRRESSDGLADTLEGIGIHTTHGLHHLGNRADAGKELDLAARRKRPRPAAIGTSRSSSMLAGSASMSPTTSRLPSYGSGPGVRQSKSAQCLNSRYAGVRKASAAQRSPLNLSTFAEAGALASSKADMSSMLQPAVTTGALAPPTPLTPEDFHHLLPTTPSDGGYCLSAQPTSQLFPTTQPMQANIASPPATPLAVDIMGSYPYQGVAPPMSAPAHYTSFPDYAAACDGSALTGRSWTDATSMPSPEAAFQSRCAIPPQGDIPSMSYEQSLDHSVDSVSGSPTLVYPTSDVDMPTLTASLAGDSKPTEFYIHEFPEQQEAHRFVAQQLPQKPKAYTFTNQTPNDFPN